MNKEESLEERAKKLDRSFLDKVGERVALNTRKLIHVGDSDVRCPLCFEPFEKRYDQHRKLFVYVCHTDKIGIRCDDPFVGKWEGALEGDKIPCPACNADMRFFCTSVGYFKAKCYKKGCGATLSTADPDKKMGTTIIPARHPEGERPS